MVYGTSGGEHVSGLLLHTKFLNTFHLKLELKLKLKEDATRQAHYAKSLEYRTYAQALRHNPNLWCDCSEQFTDWQQLEALGLRSKGRSL